MDRVGPHFSFPRFHADVGPCSYARFFLSSKRARPIYILDRPSLLRVYVPPPPPRVCFSVCMFLRMLSPSIVHVKCPFMCISLRMYVHPSVCSSVCMTLYVHFPSVCISPPCMSLFGPLCVYVLSTCIPSCVSCLYVRPSVFASLCVHAPSVCMSLHVYNPFVRLSLRVYVASYDLYGNSDFSNNRLVRSVSGPHKLTLVPTSVWSFG